MNTKVNAPIDNKNIMDDFIYSIFDDVNYIATPANKGNARNILGYFNNNLLEVRWTLGSNRACFAFVSTNENYVDYMTELPKFKEYFEKMITEINEELNLESFISGNWLICDFYWKEEN